MGPPEQRWGGRENPASIAQPWARWVRKGSRGEIGELSGCPRSAVPNRDGLIPDVSSAQRGDRAGESQPPRSARGCLLKSQFLPIHPEPSHAEPRPSDVIPCAKTFWDLPRPSEKSGGLIPTSLNVSCNAKWKCLCFLVEPRPAASRMGGRAGVCFGGGNVSERRCRPVAGFGGTSHRRSFSQTRGMR